MSARKGPKAKGAPIISRRRKQLPPAATATMIEVLEMEDQNSPKADAGKKLRTFDAKVAKNVRDNFPNWPSQLVDVLQKDGLTLRQRIARDKGSADSEVKYGAAALTNKYEQVKKDDGKKEITYADLTPFRQFAWLLTDGQSVDVKKWFDATVKDQRIVVNHHEEAQSKKPRRGGSSSSVVKDDAVAMVAKLVA